MSYSTLSLNYFFLCFPFRMFAFVPVLRSSSVYCNTREHYTVVEMDIVEWVYKRRKYVISSCG